MWRSILINLLLAFVSFGSALLYEEGKEVEIVLSSSTFSVLRFDSEVGKAVAGEGVELKVKGKEILISVSPVLEKSALWVMLKDGRTFFFVLKAGEVSPTVIDIADARKREKKTEVPVEILAPYEERIAELITRGMRGEEIPNFKEKISPRAVQTPSLLILVEREWEGRKIKVVRFTLIAREKVRIREDMEFFRNLLSMWGRPVALALSEEFLEKEESAIGVAIVRKSDED